MWKRCRGGVLYIYLHFYIIPTLFAYFLACHPYISYFLVQIPVPHTEPILYLNLGLCRWTAQVSYALPFCPTWQSVHQLKNQFSGKWISADFIVLWPTRKWKINFAWYIPFRKNRIQKRVFCLKNKFRLMHFFSEGNTKGVQNDWLFLKETIKEFSVPFSFFWRKHKGNSEWWIPFSFSLTKTKQEIEFACTLQVASFPGFRHTQMGPGNEATLQEYPVALD